VHAALTAARHFHQLAEAEILPDALFSESSISLIGRKPLSRRSKPVLLTWGWIPGQARNDVFIGFSGRISKYFSSVKTRRPINSSVAEADYLLE
jgi:hypothetical protein